MKSSLATPAGGHCRSIIISECEHSGILAKQLISERILILVPNDRSFIVTTHQFSFIISEREHCGILAKQLISEGILISVPHDWYFMVTTHLFIQVVFLRPVRHYADYHVCHTCQGEETLRRSGNGRTSRQADLDRQIWIGKCRQTLFIQGDLDRQI